MNKYTIGLIYEVRDKNNDKLLSLCPLLLANNKSKSLLCFSTYSIAFEFSRNFKNIILKKASDSIDAITSVTIVKHPVVIELFEDITKITNAITIREFSNIDVMNEDIFDYFNYAILCKNVSIGKYYYGIVRKTDNEYVLDDDNNFVYDFKSDEDCVLISANIARSIGAKALVSRLDNNI